MTRNVIVYHAPDGVHWEQVQTYATPQTNEDIAAEFESVAINHQVRLSDAGHVINLITSDGLVVLMACIQKGAAK